MCFYFKNVLKLLSTASTASICHIGTVQIILLSTWGIHTIPK